MIIRKQWLRTGIRSRPGYHLEKVKAVVIHWVGKSRETAAAVLMSLDLSGMAEAVGTVGTRNATDRISQRQ